MISALPGLGAVTPALTNLDNMADQASRTGGAVGASFSGMLSEAASNTMVTMERAESLSVQALQGTGDTRDVVDAVMSAEQSLQAAVAIRDKIVSAYLDVTRMAI